MSRYSHWLRWVFSTSLPPDQQNGQTLFDPSKSQNWQDLDGYTWNITYEDKSGASGTVGTDVVTVGGTSVSGQAVEIATYVSSDFVDDSACDGLLGLSFKRGNTGEIPSPCCHLPYKLTHSTVRPHRQNTFFDTAIPSLSSPVFTADLKYHAPGT
jgi:Eukaryotic aspartyl protease